jgi:hypothetical protein
MWFTDGRPYDGNWSDGRFDGTGTLSTAAYEYTANSPRAMPPYHRPRHHELQAKWRSTKELFKRNREGRGTMKWPSSIAYTGQWKDDKIKGFGKVTWLNGDWSEANWDGSFANIWAGEGQQGKDRARWHDKGKVYVGATKGWLRHGFGTLTTPDYKFEGNHETGIEMGASRLPSWPRRRSLIASMSMTNGWMTSCYHAVT